MAASLAAAGQAERALQEIITGLKHKNNVCQNIMEVSGRMHETFKVHVETPEVLILRIQESGSAQLTLICSVAFTAHMEGSFSHQNSSGNLVYQHTY